MTLYKIQNRWALECLCKDVKQETNPIIQHQMLAIIHEQQGLFARR